MSVTAEDGLGPESDELTTGGYVYSPPYLLMRLRMRLTGTAAPTEGEWAAALRRLLDHLETSPVPVHDADQKGADQE